MTNNKLKGMCLLVALIAFPLSCFSYYGDSDDYGSSYGNSDDYQSSYNSDDNQSYDTDTYSEHPFFSHHQSHLGRIAGSIAFPGHIDPPGEKVVIVDPRVHKFGAYDADGNLVRLGLASAGRNYCPDEHAPCRTEVGSFRVFAMGDESCYSTRFPIPRGGAPMPYCMYFNNNQALHGSYELGNANLSHGCVRMHVSDAEWLRYNFVENGTLVVVRPY